MLNVNREMYISNNSLIQALKDLLLEPARAEDFREVSGRI